MGTPLLTKIYIQTVSFIPNITGVISLYKHEEYPNFQSSLVKVYPSVDQFSLRDGGPLNILEFAQNVNTLSRLVPSDQLNSTDWESIVDSEGKVHVKVKDKNFFGPFPEEEFKDTKTKLNEKVKPNVILKLTLKGVAKEEFNDLNFPLTLKIIQKYLKKFSYGPSKITEYTFQKFHAKKRDSRLDDFEFSYGSKVGQSGELSIENIIVSANTKGYVTAKVKNYCDPEEVWGVMTDLGKTLYSLETPFCDQNSFFLNKNSPKSNPEDRFKDQTKNQNKVTSLQEFLMGPNSPFEHKIFRTHTLTIVGDYLKQLTQKFKNLFIEAKLQTPFSRSEIFPYVLVNTMSIYDRKLAKLVDETLHSISIFGKKFVFILNGSYCTFSKTGMNPLMKIYSNINEEFMVKNLDRNQSRRVVMEDIRKMVKELIDYEEIANDEDDSSAVNIAFEEIPQLRYCKEVGISEEDCSWTDKIENIAEASDHE